MTVKLNITIDEAIAHKIKSYAARKSTSVSRIVEDQLEEVLKTEKDNDRFSSLEKSEKEDDSFRKFLDKYAESIKREKPIDIDEERDSYLKEKHGI